MNDNGDVQMDSAGGNSRQGTFEAACRRVYPSAVRLAYSTLHSADDSEDAVQESFSVVFQGLLGGKQIRDLDHYLLRAVARKSIDILRARKRQPMEEVELEEALVAEELSDDARERNELIAEAAKSLPAQYSQALWLKEREGFNEREVGEILGTSQDSAQKLVKRGREQLLRRYVELAGATPGEPVDCRERTERFWDMLTSEIPEEERQEHELHSKGCLYCGPRLESMRVAASYGLVLPIAVSLLLSRRDEVIRDVVSHPVAARTAAPPRTTSMTGTRLLIGSLVIAILGTGSIPDQPTIQLQQPIPVTAAFSSPTPSPAALPSPSPSPSPSPAPSPSPSPTQTAAPSPAPTAVPAVDPCPSAPAGAIVYINSGELIYRSATSAADQVLSSTGGWVDNIWWRPGSRQVAYKTASGDGSELGTVRLYDLNSHSVAWTLARQVVYFDFSPDGRSYVGIAPNVSNGQVPTWTAEFGTVGGASTNVFTYTGVKEPWPGNYGERQCLYDTDSQPVEGAFWLANKVVDISTIVNSYQMVVGRGGLEPPTSALSARRSAS